MALRYKYSEGKTNDCESTGGFDIGFLTTDSLSKTVTITGDIIDENASEPQGFKITMYREGDETELLEGLKRTENGYENIFSVPIYWTTYKYEAVKKKRNVDARRLGI